MVEGVEGEVEAGWCLMGEPDQDGEEEALGGSIDAH
jgi:hypothetical protein